MAKKRTLNRMDYRGDFDEEGGEAAKAEEEEDEDEEGDEEEEGEAEAEPDVEGEPDEGAGDDDEDAPKPKKKKKVVAAPKVKRTRAPKIVRMKAMWVVLDNSSKQLSTFDYGAKKEAEQYLEQKNIDKKGTCYMQLVKVPLEDKEKEEKKK